MQNNVYFGKDLEAMSFAVNYHRWIIEEFRPYLGPSAAEIGAGTGNFSQLLCDTGIGHLIAFEPSANIYPLLHDKFKKNEKVTTVNSFLSEAIKNYQEVFDSVVYVNVLEHVADDKKELSYVYRSLKNGGYLLVFVPALSWLYSDFDHTVGHFRRYHKKGLQDMVQSSGFDIKKVRYFDLMGILPWYITFVLLKKPMTSANVSLYDKLVVPVMRNIEKFIPPPIGKNLLLIARKI